ncbi:hypothetical protein P355_0463 [Burkholderia cenocepacia KC-01]|nr:hypothetical protein P355_0463 [Burkholderia cenocepacia KC-01]
MLKGIELAEEHLDIATVRAELFRVDGRLGRFHGSGASS